MRGAAASRVGFGRLASRPGLASRLGLASRPGLASRLGLALGLGMALAVAALASASQADAHLRRLRIPDDADQLIVVSSPTADPRDDLARFDVYQRAGTGSPWQRVDGTWRAETGSGHLLAAARRREGDHATPIGVFSIGATMYGNRPRPTGLHYAYHRLVCGDWWDEDPFTRRYNRFVHVACGATPSFAAWSEALWTERRAYPYFAVIDFNTDPVRAGRLAPGSGIFLHSWVDGPTEGCVALPEARLLEILRWLRPSLHPAIEIGLDRQLARL